MIRRVAPLPLAMFSCVREEHDSDLKYRTNKQNEFTLGTANTGGGEALRSTLVTVLESFKTIFLQNLIRDRFGQGSGQGG